MSFKKKKTFWKWGNELNTCEINSYPKRTFHLQVMIGNLSFGKEWPASFPIEQKGNKLLFPNPYSQFL
jgi:hypothetical protein